MEEYITRKEYEEHNKRMEDEHHRIHRRLEEAEKNGEENHKLFISIERLALNMENMQKELNEQLKRQEAQEKEIKELKDRDGDKWRTVTKCVITGIVGLVIGYIFKQLGM